jgi:hypothetical protein
VPGRLKNYYEYIRIGCSTEQKKEKAVGNSPGKVIRSLGHEIFDA